MHSPKALFLVAALTAHLVAQSPAAPAPAPAPAPPPPPSILGFALTGSTTIGTDYIFRGLTQTDGNPTIQGELDLVHPSGFYLSTSLSNISWFTDQNAGVANAPTSLGSPAAVGAPYVPGKANNAPVEVDLFGATSDASPRAGPWISSSIATTTRAPTTTSEPIRIQTPPRPTWD